jgi:hypothetical protein
MEIGGSQLNAIELAGAVRDRGHNVIIASRLGPLVDLVHRLGLTHVPLPNHRTPLSRNLCAHLTKLVTAKQIDVVHGYEWPPAIALLLGPHVVSRKPVVCTIMSMAVAPFLPRRMPLIVGTDHIRLSALAHGYSDVTLLEPPVDTVLNAPDGNGATFRAMHDFSSSTLLLVMVGRLARQLKLEGLLSACDAVGAMAAEGQNVQLAIVGDGECRHQVEERAQRANACSGKHAVVLVGAMNDPRPAYAAADVVLGMGGSAIRGLSFAKPLVVQGERGFWRLCTPDTVAQFLHSGWYGVGDLAMPFDDHSLSLGAALLRKELEPIRINPTNRTQLGAFGRQLAVERFSLSQAAALQERVYSDALRDGQTTAWPEVAQSLGGVAWHEMKLRVQRLQGSQVSEDFNAISSQTAVISSTQPQRVQREQR